MRVDIFFIRETAGFHPTTQENVLSHKTFGEGPPVDMKCSR